MAPFTADVDLPRKSDFTEAFCYGSVLLSKHLAIPSSLSLCPVNSIPQSLCEKLFLPSSVFARFTSTNTTLRLDSIKIKNGNNL